MTRIKQSMATDAKFYKPNDTSQTAYSITGENLATDIRDLHDLAYYTPMGKRLAVVATDLMLGGRFVLDDPRDEMIAQQEQQISELGKQNQIGQLANKGAKEAQSPPHVMKRKDSMKTGEEKKMENFFEEFWPCFNRTVSQHNATGVGMPIRYKDGEDITDFKYKIYAPRAVPAGSDAPKHKWICPETRNFLRATAITMPPHLDILDWATEWQWWEYKIHKSRIHPLCLQPSEEQWYGIGDIEPCKTSLYALHNLELGTLDRIAAWALQLLIFRIDFQKTLGAKKAQLDELAKSMGHENWKLLDKAEDLIQLNDKVGMGQELLDIATTMIAFATGYPVVWLKGNPEGAITGSEVDLTQVQVVFSNKQTKLNNYIKKIMLDYYNIDADDLFWKMSIFTVAQAMQGQGPNAQKPGGFGGGSKPNPFGGGLKTPQRPNIGMKSNLTDKTPGDD